MSDPTTFWQYLRYLHIGAGMVGFFVAPAALATRKGGAAHRRWGQVFFYAMLVAGLTAVALAFVKGLTFLLLTGLFSLYLSYLGYRALYQKQLGRGQQPAPYDWLGTGLALVVFAGTVVFGVMVGLSNNWGGASIPIVFGLIGMRLAVAEWQKLRHPEKVDRTRWFFDHMRGFITSYIAAVSAFSATSFTFLPVWLRFLWPTIVGVPLMVWWIRRYKRQFAQGRRVAEVAQVRVE